MSDKNVRGHLCAFSANVMWGLMSPIGKSAILFFTPIMLTSFRMVGACIAFWILSLFTRKEKIERKDRLRIFLASFVTLIFNQGMFIFGLSMTSPNNASIITTTLPIITMIVAAFYLKEPVSGKKIIGIMLGAGGALMLILSNTPGAAGGGHILGDLLILLAQFSFSIYLTVFKSLTQRYSPVTLNKWMFLYASCCYLPFSVGDIYRLDWSALPFIAIGEVLYVVLCGSFLAYICIMTAQRLMRPTVVSMYNYVQPIVASIVAVAMGIGVFGWQKGVAIGLVFVGVYVVTQSKSKADLKKVGQ